jgi:hypothetical protein
MVNLETTDRKNLVVIHAENNVGKTTFLKGFTWCLFKKENFKRRAYLNDYIFSQLNNSETAIASVTLIFDDRQREYSVKRSITVSNVGGKQYPKDESLEVKIDAFTITDESKTNNSFTIFPNPSSGMVYIQSTNDDLTEIKVYDYQGKLLKDVKIKSNSTNIYEINLSKYPGGIYFFELKAGAGSVFRKITKL